jgi:hypothetical protein
MKKINTRSSKPDTWGTSDHFAKSIIRSKNLLMKKGLEISTCDP